MCGIAGVIDPSSSTELRQAAVTRMCGAMFHRGPDDMGIEASGPATLGMRRLAIFDPANGHQPWLTPDGRFTLIRTADQGEEMTSSLKRHAFDRLVDGSKTGSRGLANG